MLRCAHRLLVKKRRMKRGRKEIATKEQRRIKWEIAETENNTVMAPLSQQTEQNMRQRNIVSIVDMDDQQMLPDATNPNTHLRNGNVRGEERPRKRPP